MKILITGATGLIGRELVEQCNNDGISVHYFTTRKTKIEDRSNYRGFYWNPVANEIDITAFEGVSAIINLAGANIGKRWTKRYKADASTSCEIKLHRSHALNVNVDNLVRIVT